MKTLLTILLFVLIATTAHARGFEIAVKLQCNTTEMVMDMLSSKYNETSTGGGMSNGGQIRLFESHHAGEKQTWTLVVSNPNGQSCILSGGDDWTTNPKIPKGDPS